MRGRVAWWVACAAALAACGDDGTDVPDGGAGDAGRDAARDDAGTPSDGGGGDAAPDDAGPGVDAALPALRDDGIEPGFTWEEQARRLIDGAALPAAFAAAGYTLPDGAEVYAVRIVEGAAGPMYVLYEAGGGAFSQDFWPASTVKLLAALGAIEFVSDLGYTGAATVTFDTGFSDTLRAIYDRAIRVSSNIDYDRTVRIAGFDAFNEAFLSEARGFPTTVIQRSYSGIGVRSTPGLTLDEDGRSDYVAARDGVGDHGCPPDGNCASLFELTEAVRRLMLDTEVPPAERFAIDPADQAAVADALCGATPSFFAGGAARALGGSPRICHKPGWVPYNDCLDHGLVEDASTGARYLLAASVPETLGRTDCAPLDPLAEQVLAALAAATGGVPLAPDAGIPIVVQLDDGGPTPEMHRRYTITVDAPGADHVALSTDGYPIGEADGGPRFTIEYDYASGGERLLVVEASVAGAPVGHRALRVAITPP